MKRKSLSLHSDTTLKLHALIFAVFVIGVWYAVVATINYEGNATVPFSAYKGFILNRMGLTMFWGVIFILHLIAFQTRAWWQKRQHQQHLNEVSALQERYSSSRLDLESQVSEGPTEEDLWSYQDHDSHGTHAGSR